MTLSAYLSEDRGRAAEIANALGVSAAFVSFMASGGRKTPLDRCPAIERATDGRVTADQLRPDVRWARVPDPAWPHPGGRPCIDVAAPQEVRDAA